jgi:Mn-dependent DtxR family transcriptional regulator
MQVNESIEDYLEQILIQQEKSGCARSVDIASSLGVTKASVSHATKLLRENGYIQMADDKCITLTLQGREIAENIYQRHLTLAKFLMHLGVQEETAFADACRMEHDISSETFAAICEHASGGPEK